jgi:nitroreductase
MKFSKSVFDVIKNRTSWRTYSEKPLESDVIKKLEDFLKKMDYSNPFDPNGEKSRIKLIKKADFSNEEKNNLGQLTTFILGEYDFIAGLVQKTEYNWESFGYSFEKVILKATDMNLGTCWMAGFFNRDLFGEKVEKSQNESFPAISPVGYLPNARSEIEIGIRKRAKADEKKQWEFLFFNGDPANFLSKEVAGNYEKILESIRLGPSSSNMQGWRIIKEVGKNVYHLFSAISRLRIDMGIACCHFDLGVKELGLNGLWKFENPNIKGTEELTYTISWHEKE